MFDFAWSEIAVVLLIALLVIGPKELPNAVRGLAEFVRKARRMAGEFQVHVDEMMRETKLDEVKRQIDEVRSGVYDMKRDVERSIDEHGVRDAFKDPFTETGSTSATATPAAPSTSPTPEPSSAEPAPSVPQAEAPAAVPPPPPAPKGPPAFVPPGTVPPPASAKAPAVAAPAPDAPSRDLI